MNIIVLCSTPQTAEPRDSSMPSLTTLEDGDQLIKATEKIKTSRRTGNTYMGVRQPTHICGKMSVKFQLISVQMQFQSHPDSFVFSAHIRTLQTVLPMLPWAPEDALNLPWTTSRTLSPKCRRQSPVYGSRWASESTSDHTSSRLTRAKTRRRAHKRSWGGILSYKPPSDSNRVLLWFSMWKMFHG